MKKVLFAFCLVSVLFACLTFASAAGDKIWDFTTASGMAEWSPNGSVAHQITDIDDHQRDDGKDQVMCFVRQLAGS